MRHRLLLALVLWLAAAWPIPAAVRLVLDGTVPPGLRFARGSVTIAVRVTGDSPGSADVTVFANPGGQTVAAGLALNGPSVSLTVPLPAGVDGQLVSIFAVAQQQGGPLVPADRTLSVIADDVGPAGLTVSAPPFPATVLGGPLLIRGAVTRAGGAPEPEGRVEVLAAALGRTIGAGAILADGRFTAAADLGLFAQGSTNTLTLRAFDAAGNTGPAFSGDVKLGPPGSGQVAFQGLAMAPPSGSLTNNPAVRVEGRVQGGSPPYRVDFLIDGFLESQLTGLGSGQPFGHTLALPSDGTHQVSIAATDAAGVKAASPVGTLTLDRVAPGPPIIVEPPPGSPVVTREDRVRVRGFLGESPSAGRAPSVIFTGPQGVRFEPAQPQSVTDPTGQFVTTVVLAGLPDGDYPIRIAARDAAGNENGLQVVRLGIGAGRLAVTLSIAPGADASKRAAADRDMRRRWLDRVAPGRER